jgi:hypothetical protein
VKKYRFFLTTAFSKVLNDWTTEYLLETWKRFYTSISYNKSFFLWIVVEQTSANILALKSPICFEEEIRLDGVEAEVNRIRWSVGKNRIMFLP